MHRAPFLLAVASLAVGGRAHAQTAEDRSAAVQLFDTASLLMDEGRVREACAKFSESYRLDPQLGVLLHWADCLEQEGRFASAYAAFRDASDLALRKRDERAAVARERTLALEPRLSRVVVLAPQFATLPELHIELGTLRLGRDSLGVGIALDPGEYPLRVTATGYAPFIRSVRVESEQRTLTVSIPPLDKPGASTAVGAVPAPAPRVDSPPRKEEVARKSLGGARLGAAIVAGAGVVAAGVGVGFYLDYRSRLGQRESLCPNNPCQPDVDVARVRELEHDARRSGALAIGFSIGSAVSLASAALLYFMAPRKDAQSSGLRVEFGPTYAMTFHTLTF